MTSTVVQLAVSYPGIDIELDASWTGNTLVLFGPSGSGKSTLIEALAGLRPEVTGRVTIGDTVFQDTDSGVWLSPQKRNVGWVPQDAALFPHLSVERNIAFGLPSSGRVADHQDMLETFDITDLLPRRVGTLSGGERHRVALARALVRCPRLLLLDEPLASLDAPLKSRILSFLTQIQKTTDVTLVYVSHDPREVLQLDPTVAVLERGKQVALGAAREVFAEAQALSVLESLGVENVFRVTRCDDLSSGLVTVQTDGGTQLAMSRARGGNNKSFGVAVSADDLLLSCSRVTRTSARNQMNGKIESIQPTGFDAYVRIQIGGDTWVARVSQSAVSDLELVPGLEVWVLLKSSAIHLANDETTIP